MSMKEQVRKYETYEELEARYKEILKDYDTVLDILNTKTGKLAYQNMMLSKFREAYKYIIEGEDENGTNCK